MCCVSPIGPAGHFPQRGKRKFAAYAVDKRLPLWGNVINLRNSVDISGKYATPSGRFAAGSPKGGAKFSLPPLGEVASEASRWGMQPTKMHRFFPKVDDIAFDKGAKEVPASRVQKIKRKCS